MKIGYPCINRSIGCTANHTFRLASYSRERLYETVEKNVDCLFSILRWNIKNGFYFFRISSQIVPFASHSICRVNWQKHFSKDFEKIGTYVKKNKIRISMHPDQFVLINSPHKRIFNRSIKELVYHAQLLNLMKLDATAKIVIHVGGVYGNKGIAIERFCRNYAKLPMAVKKRLIIEHDERSYSLKDCLRISENVQIPVVFDTLHHAAFNNGESINEALTRVAKTWRKKDGVPIVHYSDQEKGGRPGKHAESINMRAFKRFIEQTKDFCFDVMLEIKDKEKSAKKALNVIKSLRIK